jgi:hypothetical protein
VLTHDWCTDDSCEIDHDAHTRLENIYEGIAVETAAGIDF